MELMTSNTDTKTQEDPKAVKPEPVKYDPTKKYKWEHTDVFTMSGTEFGATMNALGTFLSIYGPPVELAKKAYESMQRVLKDAVESGVAQELPNEESQE